MQLKVDQSFDPMKNSKQLSIVNTSNIQKSAAEISQDKSKSRIDDKEVHPRKGNRYLTLAIDPTTGEKTVYQQNK